MAVSLADDRPVVSIIMPSFNEGEHIVENIRTTRSILDEIGMNAEIIAVDDGSTDNTLSEIERAASIVPGVVPARNPYNMGKGMALRTGFDYSRGDIIVFLDADLDVPPEQIRDLIAILENAPSDVVITSKHHPRSQLQYPWFRKAASFCYFMIIKVLFGLPVRDTQTGLKVFRRKVLDAAFHRLLVKKFAYDVELLAVAVRLGFSVREVPVVMQFKRNLKWGRISFGDIMSIFIDTMAVFYRLRILHYYDAERPPIYRDSAKILVIVQGCPPPDEIIDRLSVDADIHLACIAAPEERDGRANVAFYASLTDLIGRLNEQGEPYAYIGFLGRGMTPMGSWVNNAVRNFSDPEVTAVCGPVISGPVDSAFSKTSALLRASWMTAGPDNHLYSIKPVRDVTKGFPGNLFLRSSCIGDLLKEDCGILFEDGYVCVRPSRDGRMRYDPDMAVSRSVPPLITPYFSMVMHEGYERGAQVLDPRGRFDRIWAIFPVVLCIVLFFGWLFLPNYAYIGVAAVYVQFVLLTALFTFDPVQLPLMSAGIVVEHFIRAVSFVPGFLSGLAGFRKSGKQ